MDGRGVPLSLIVTAANVNDGKRLDEVLQAIVVKRERPPVRRNKHLCADAGYRSAENLRVIDGHGYIAHVVDRKREAEAKRRHPTLPEVCIRPPCRRMPSHQSRARNQAPVHLTGSPRWISSRRAI